MAAKKKPFKFKTPLRLAVERKTPETCRQWLLCENVATMTLPHPILGELPSCKRCAEKMARISGKELID
jgi:hypothetical protein